MHRKDPTIANRILPRVLLDCYYRRVKERLQNGLFSLDQVEELADLLMELVNRKREEQESGEQEG